MAKEALERLSESMFYLLLSLTEERAGNEISQHVSELTNGIVTLPPGTLYTLLARFVDEDFITVSSLIGKRKYYRITPLGLKKLQEETQSMKEQIRHYEELLVKRSQGEDT